MQIGVARTLFSLGGNKSKLRVGPVFNILELCRDTRLLNNEIELLTPYTFMVSDGEGVYFTNCHLGKQDTNVGFESRRLANGYRDIVRKMLDDTDLNRFYNVELDKSIDSLALPGGVPFRSPGGVYRYITCHPRWTENNSQRTLNFGITSEGLLTCHIRYPGFIVTTEVDPTPEVTG